MILTIYCDGGAIPNPGQGYGSYKVIDQTGRSRSVERHSFQGTMTNNEAEWHILLKVLSDIHERLKKNNISSRIVTLEIKSDSQLVVNMVSGLWSGSDPRMLSLCNQVKAQLSLFQAFSITHVKRDVMVDIFGH